MYVGNTVPKKNKRMGKGGSYNFKYIHQKVKFERRVERGKMIQEVLANAKNKNNFQKKDQGR